MGPLMLLAMPFFIRYIKIGTVHFLIAFSLRNGQTFLEFDSSFIRYKTINSGYIAIKRDEIFEMKRLSWGGGYRSFETIFVKTKDFKVIIPLQGLNSEEIDIIYDLRDNFADKFKN